MNNFKKNSNKPFFPTKSSRKSMVSWFAPKILLQTLKELVLSKIVGSQVDTRELQSVNENVHNITPQISCKIKSPYTVGADEDFYFDFIADTGDGWDSTYTMASLLSRDQLIVEDSKKSHVLPRGKFLLLGGDEIYPSPSEKGYQERLLEPFRRAWDWMWLVDIKTPKNNSLRDTGRYLKLKDKPDIYAIPGNHDWYDSLIAFRKVFCNVFKLNSLGQWKTNQARSYFALSLPHDWVVLAFDFGLDLYKLDGLQYHYFYNIISQLKSESRLIIIAAEPNWVYGGVQNKQLNQAYEDIENMIDEIFLNQGKKAPKIYLNISGDTHNYQRYENLNEAQVKSKFEHCVKQYNCSSIEVEDIVNTVKKQHKRYQIVSGGGGAFLHPTHSTTQDNMTIIPNSDYKLGEHSPTPEKSEIEIKDLYQLKKCYPAVDTSKKIANKLLFKFLPNNIKLGFFIATIYLVLAWPMRAFLDSVIIQKQFNGFADSGLNFLTLLISVLLIAGFTLWARSKPSKMLTIAGLIHGFLQVMLLYGGYVLVYFLMSYLWQRHDLEYGWFLFPIARDTVFFVMVSFFSPLFLSIALWVYLNYLNANQNDLFGSRSIAQFKHLLRFKINPLGQLIIFPIAIENVSQYSMPTNEETTKEHLEALIKHNGKEWNKIKSCAPNKNERLIPQVLKYHLIEDPIVITPE